MRLCLSIRSSKITFAVPCILSLVGCATQQIPIGDDVASKIKRVAVVSITAKSFSRQYTGLTVFGNEKEEIDISDWKIDAQYEEQIRYQLRNEFGLDLVVAPYSELEFSHVNDLNGPWDAPAFWGPNWGAIELTTKNYCNSNSLDAVLVLAKGKTSDFISGSNQSFGGAGIYARGPMGKTAVLHLISKVALLDCATAKPLAIRPLAAKQNGLYGEVIRSSPLLPINFDESRAPIQQWSPELKQRIRSNLANLPNPAIAETLKSIFPAKIKL
jgi:hypothetical protein